jgi:ribonucleoside-diphosphate reductase alpha chain
MSKEKKARPKQVAGKTIKIATGCGSMYVTVNTLNGKVFEVFAALGKAGSCAKVQSEAVTRLITLALRFDVPLEEIVKEIESLRCPSPTWEDKVQVSSCPDAIAKVLKEELSKDEH